MRTEKSGGPKRRENMLRTKPSPGLAKEVETREEEKPENPAPEKLEEEVPPQEHEVW